MTSKPKPKLAHVAVAAGVSIGTASDALSGRGRMSEQTRQRVIAEAERIGYRPDARARALAVGQSHIIALVVQRSTGESAGRVYWPKVQAAFSEEVFTHGYVPCTMSVDDLHQLDGLPFDLLVFAGVTDDAELPAQLRQSYRVLDFDVSGADQQSDALREEIQRATEAVFERFAALGSQRPALAINTSAGLALSHFVDSYRAWCRDHGVDPNVMIEGEPRPDLTDPEVDADDARRAGARGGFDAVFCVLNSGGWLAEQVDPAHPLTRDRVVALVSQPWTGSDVPAQSLRFDGEALGRGIARNAIARLAGRPMPVLRINWLLDGHALLP